MKIIFYKILILIFFFFFEYLQDFCYENDAGTFDMVDVINMCVTVIAYSPDSFRSGQMLVSTCLFKSFW